MDESLSIFFWTLAGAFSFALVGGLFGGVAGWLSWRSGSASGSIIGKRVADALARLAEGELTEAQRGAVVGACDGALFLGLIGTLIGLVAGRYGEVPSAWLLPAFGILLLLAAGALVFGLLAYGLVGLRVRAVFGVFVGGMGGALLAAGSVGIAHLVPGAVFGVILGTLAALALPPRR